MSTSSLPGADVTNVVVRGVEKLRNNMKNLRSPSSSMVQSHLLTKIHDDNTTTWMRRLMLRLSPDDC